MGRTGGGMDEGVHIEPLVLLLDWSHRPGAFGCPDPTQDRFEPDPVLILGPGFHSYARQRLLPFRYQVGEVCLKAACAAGSASSDRGRGT